MKTARPRKAAHPGRVAGITKGKEVIPLPPKQPISSAGIFKHKSKSVKKPTVAANVHRSAVQKPAKPASSSPSKVEKTGPRKEDDMHPLAVEFNGKTLDTLLLPRIGAQSPKSG